MHPPVVLGLVGALLVLHVRGQLELSRALQSCTRDAPGLSQGLRARAETDSARDRGAADRLILPELQGGQLVD